MRILIRLLAPAALLAALPLAQAAAQQMIRPAPQPGAGPAAPAPALPGLATRRAPAPIEGDPSVVLSPNAALFDAITRGDTAAARDAVGRGASLEARNQLGLTPLDAAVDQGRHDIAFFLLSARDIARGRPAGGGAVGAASLADPPPAAPARREAPVPPTRSAAVTPAAAPAPAPNARLWAGNGGAPRPEVGFLGFDAGRPAGAEPPRR